MKSIETQNWDITKPIGEQYLGQKKAVEVFNEIENNLKEELLNTDISYEYIALDMDFKSKEAIFPLGLPIAYAKSGNSEGYRVGVAIVNEGRHISFMSVKTYSKNEALIISNILTEMLSF